LVNRIFWIILKIIIKAVIGNDGIENKN